MKKPLTLLVSAFLILGLTLGMSFIYRASASVPGTNYLVSQDASGVYANSISDRPYLSGDGRYVEFESSATNLVSGDTNNVQDVFVKDTTTGIVTRVSISPTGTQYSVTSQSMGITYDGRYALFSVSLTGMAGGVLAVYDTVNNTTKYVLQPGSTTYGMSGGAISADGKYVLTGNEPYANQNFQVTLVNMLTGVSRVISVDSTGNPGNATSNAEGISCDGGVMAFSTAATNVGTGAGQYIAEINQSGGLDLTQVPISRFVNDTVSCNGNILLYYSSGEYEYNRLTGQSTAVAHSGASDATMSDDGRYVGFTYQGSLTTTPLYPSTGAGVYSDTYLYDTKTGTTQLVTFTVAGNRSGDAIDYAVISPDGTKIAYVYQTPNSSDVSHELISGLTTGGSSSQQDVYTSLTGY